MRVGSAMACVVWWLWAWTAANSHAEPLELPLAGWSFEAKGNFSGRVDRRELFQVVHPLEPAKAGDYGRMVTQAVIPEVMKPPYTLQFYVSDNIYGEGHTKTWSVADVRAGHRFKQVLVDDKVVWSQDTAVNMPVSDQKVTLVDLTPGRSTLCFGAAAVAGSGQQPGDAR